MGVFDKIKSVSAAKGQNYIRAGRYMVRIERVKKDTSKKDSEEYVAIELAVLAVLSTEPRRNLGAPDASGNRAVEAGEVIPLHAAGDTPSHVLKPLKADVVLGNYKKFLMRATNTNEVDIEPSDCNLACSEENPLGGTVMEVDVKVICTEKRKTPFTAVEYVRTVPLAEAAQKMTQAVKDLFYPGTSLDEALKAA